MAAGIFERFSVNSLIGSGSGDFNFSVKPLSTAQQNHMKNVFACLFGGIIMTGIGAYVSFNAFMVPPLLAVIVQIAATIYISSTTHVQDDSKIRSPKRLLAFAVASFATGCSIMPLLAYSARVDPALIVHAFFITMAIFICFFLAAAFAKQRSYLYLGALLGSATSYLSIIALFNLFFRARLAHNILLYGGLVVAVGYLYYFTQKTIADFEHGNRDYVLHGLHFYLELVSIFVRILIILTKREEDKDEDRRRKR